MLDPQLLITHFAYPFAQTKNIMAGKKLIFGVKSLAVVTFDCY